VKRTVPGIDELFCTVKLTEKVSETPETWETQFVKILDNSKRHGQSIYSTVNGKDVSLQLPVVEITVYVPALDTTMELVVAPVDQSGLVQVVLKVTLPPVVQIV
jgi:hypothetical protein